MKRALIKQIRQKDKKAEYNFYFEMLFLILLTTIREKS